ncbi:MAG: phosphoglucosamine mutase [Endomicrobium sp.]|jgi:phosphoglucosamine mutase|nr:phosphoglucosamine mutase [Endomicrobium sp.]
MKLFGTDGIRGDSSKFPFDNDALFITGKAIAEVLAAAGKKILIIRDTRKSGKRIQNALANGMASAGAVAVFGGIMPTPAASFFLRSGQYWAGAVISASHNPYRDNGIKIFNSKGSKLTDSVESKIEKKINKYMRDGLKFSTAKIEKREKNGLLKSYEHFLSESFGKGTLKNKKIVIDCANGAAYKSASNVLKKLGAKVIALNVKPDGKNINRNCGALYPEVAAAAVKKHKAFCGFCFDGDADRLICIDENGNIKDGDFFLGSMARYLKSRKKLKNNVLVTTVMANIGLIKAMEKEKIKVVTEKVGDRYVMEAMKKHKAVLGGEQSGHFIFRDILGAGDGLLSALQLLSALNYEGKTVSQMFCAIEKFPQVLINKTVAKKEPLEKLQKTSSLIKGYERKLGADGRILVRYSGTENLLRVMVEGTDKIEIGKMAQNIISCADKEISGKAI